MPISSCLRFTDVDHSTTFTDSSGKTWSRGSGTNAEILDNSLSLDGASYIYTPAHVDFDNGSGDFTIHGYLDLASLPGVGSPVYLFDQADGADDRVYGLIYEDTGNYFIEFLFTSGGVDVLWAYAQLPLPVVGTWYHWAIVRSGNNNILYFDGLQVGVTVVASYTFPTLTANLNLGCRYTFAKFFDGKMDDFTWFKGGALWTENTYTPPARSATPVSPPAPTIPIPDPPQWTLYDRDYKTVVGILRPLNGASLYLRLNEPGSGTMTIPYTDAVFKLLKSWQYVSLNYRGAWRGGFFIEDLKFVDVNSSEYSGKAVTISGRGTLYIMDDAIVWDWGTPLLGETTRKFGTNGIFPPVYCPMPKGYMLYTLMDEAHNLQNEGGVTSDRRVWWLDGVTGGTTTLTWDFYPDQDSGGTPWSDAEDLEFRLGMTHLEIIMQFAAAQSDFVIEQDFVNGGFILHYYDDRIGDPNKYLDVNFFPGQNCLDVSREKFGGDVRNADLIQFTHPSNCTTDLYEEASITAFRRVREGFLQAANCSSSASALSYGAAEQEKSAYTRMETNIKVTDSVGPRAFIDYEIGDTVWYSEIFENMTDYWASDFWEHVCRVLGMSLTFTEDNPFADIVLEIEPDYVET